MKILNKPLVIQKPNETIVYFKVKSKKIYEQRIVISNKEIVDWNCTCVFGSAYRFAEKFMVKDVKCKHIKLCIDELKKLGLIK